MRFLLLIFIITVGFTSCKNDVVTLVDVSNVDVEFIINRFDVDFYSSTAESLETTKSKYPFLFPTNTPDSIWLSKINDKDEQELFLEVQKKYTNLSYLNNDLTSLFKHVKYYNNKFTAPNVITMLTNIDYDNRIVYRDSILLISLDAYLGEKHQFYEDYPNYIKQNNHKAHIVVDVANAIINTQTREINERDFISKMISEGRKMYLLDLYLPKVSDKEKTGYTIEKLNWALENEEQIWKYFIERKLLYSTDTSLNKRFLDNGPFSKFYLSQDNLSPGRVGSWLGLQIVRSYMIHNGVSLQELLNRSTSEIYKKSKYKPKK